MKNHWKQITVLSLTVLLLAALCACAIGAGTDAQTLQQSADGSAATKKTETAQSGESASVTNVANVSSGGAIDASELFKKRELTQTAELSEAVTCTVSDGNDINITQAGVYVLQGSAKNVTVFVEAGDEDKVQLVLDGLSVTNDDFPVIYVKNDDKVFVTTTEGSENSLSVTGSFVADGSTNTDAVIFSRDDLVFNGLGSLSISSTDNGISGKDDIKLTGGVLTVSAQGHGIEANDSIAVCGGTVTVSAGKDGLHAENEDDDSEGWIYLCGGTLDITATDDGVHAVSIVQIDGGVLSVNAAEGIEGTWVQLNDGAVTIQARDDGINGARMSTAYTTCIELNGGTLTVSMGQGDTDAIDSNGNLVITGGVINITAQSPFDYDGSLTHTGGTITVNGVETDEISNQVGGGFGGGNGGFGGGPGGNGGHGGGGWHG
ncbi:MAG: carbohydrate-binding domain-containing protein [Oscillospiraceae bacterium]|nr:carbohydrate-binding domain-containing protein [Oscillospiraceae bacterium]MBQ6160236.1 carbohydrate-binding domain-containing protein [Oscillospiraceae bacterium]